MNRVVDPLLQCIDDTASRLPRVDQAAYTLNCVYQIHSSLSLYEYVDERLENLQVSYTIFVRHLQYEFFVLYYCYVNPGLNGESVGTFKY